MTLTGHCPSLASMLAACALVMGFGMATECLMLPACATDATRAYKMYFSDVQCTVKNSSLGLARSELKVLPDAVGQSLNTSAPIGEEFLVLPETDSGVHTRDGPNPEGACKTLVEFLHAHCAGSIGAWAGHVCHAFVMTTDQVSSISHENSSNASVFKVMGTVGPKVAQEDPPEYEFCWRDFEEWDETVTGYFFPTQRPVCESAWAGRAAVRSGEASWSQRRPPMIHAGHWGGR